MRELALKKSIERRDLLLEKIRSKNKQLQKNEIVAEDLLLYSDNCRYEFKGYINSLMDIGIITDDDIQTLWDGFIYEMDSIK